RTTRRLRHDHVRQCRGGAWRPTCAGAHARAAMDARATSLPVTVCACGQATGRADRTGSDRAESEAPSGTPATKTIGARAASPGSDRGEAGKNAGRNIAEGYNVAVGSLLSQTHGPETFPFFRQISALLPVERSLNQKHVDIGRDGAVHPTVAGAELR